ncbi:MAG TPA: endolytic transglycosylase MltG [Candidatus Paceibacterota bacterium]|nr:endolytic transglycosylase MltG [Candidatus Paceibacterota bacterium]
MDRFSKIIGHLFARAQKLQDHLSLEWREHVNRRTLVILSLAGLLAGLVYVFIIQPPNSFPTDQLVTIPDGASLDQTAKILKEDGVVRSELAFKLIVTLLGHERGVHAGDYEFKEPTDIFTVAHAVSVGAFGLVPYRIRIPEGATMRQMANIYAQVLPRFNSANFLAQTNNMEGYLFPDTYFFMPNATDATVIQAMRGEFDTKIAPLQAEIASSTHSLSEIVTMASLLEEEAANPTDRRMIAGILWHRIALGYPLQVDSTLIYSLQKPDTQLTISDLKGSDPYNTYVHKGLPPTPIGSPSYDSIVAALEPTPSDYLYYLADRSGVTHYAKTYAQQQHNEQIYLGH